MVNSFSFAHPANEPLFSFRFWKVFLEVNQNLGSRSCKFEDMGVEPKIGVGFYPPKSSILIGFSMKFSPSIWGVKTPIFGSTPFFGRILRRDSGLRFSIGFGFLNGHEVI